MIKIDPGLHEFLIRRIRNDDRPAWLWVHDRLERACRAGLLRPGQRLPSENALSDVFGISRMTLRRALTRLQQSGLLQSRKGVGIFVRSAPVQYRVQSNRSFAASLRAEGHEIATRLLDCVTGKAGEAEAARLGIVPGAGVIRIRRLRLLEGIPLYVADKLLPEARFPHFDRVFQPAHSLSDVYEHHGVTIYRRSGLIIAGTHAQPAEAEALILNEGAPVLRYSYVNTDPDGRAIEASTGFWPMGAVEFEIVDTV